MSRMVKKKAVVIMSTNGSRNKHIWDPHPGVRSGQDLKRGERWADHVRNQMGSWPFVIIMLMAMVVWMLTKGFGADRPPFGGLNLALSTLAGLQAAILLIAAKRADQVASELAQHDHLILTAMKELMEQNKETWFCKHYNEMMQEIEEHTKEQTKDAVLPTSDD